MLTPLLSEPYPQQEQPIEESGYAHLNRDPLIPTIVEQASYETSPGFQVASYENIVNYLRSGLANGVIPTSQTIEPNAIYYGFVFTGQFL
jgi:hypothetical protein